MSTGNREGVGVGTLPRPPRLLARLPEQPYTARLAGAGSLRRELESLLEAASPDAPPDILRNLVIHSNVTGKSSAAAMLWVWKRLKLRYVLDPSICEYRVFVKAMQGVDSPAERGLLCFLMFARTDRLFREVTLQCVSPFLPQADTTIDPSTAEAAIHARAKSEGLNWSANTLDRARSHLLAALKDFGVLRGSLTKRIVPPQPGHQVTVFAAHLGRLEGLTDRQLLDSEWFSLLGLSPERTVDLLYAAARAGALGFRMQADIVEVELPRMDGGSE